MRERGKFNKKFIPAINELIEAYGRHRRPADGCPLCRVAVGLRRKYKKLDRDYCDFCPWVRIESVKCHRLISRWGNTYEKMVVRLERWLKERV